MEKHQYPKKRFLKYILALLLFGSNGIVASHISLTSYEIVFLRALIGSLLLLILFGATGGSFDLHKNKRHLMYLVISGAAMGTSWMFLYEAYQQIGVSIASLAYYCDPVIVMALSPLLFQERFTLPKLTGFATVISGILLINIQALQEGRTGWGLFCGGMSALMYAAMVIFNKKAYSITGINNSMLQLTISFVTVGIFTVLRDGFSFHISSGDWIPILILGLLNTGIGCYLYFSSIGHLPVQTVAVCGYLEPLSAVVFSVLFLGETMQPLQIIGAAMIIGGAVLAEGIVRAKITG